MESAQIKVKVELDSNKIPEKIFWTSESLDEGKIQETKAILLSFWDGKENTAMRLDLWTKDMRVEEMAEFFYQTFMSLSSTYHKSVPSSKLNLDIQKFANDFMNKFKNEQFKK